MSEPVPGAVPAVDLSGRIEGVDVLVWVLGEVQATQLSGQGDEVETPLVPTRQKGLEAIVYLALRQSPVDREDLATKLFRDGANAAKTLYTAISSARKLVGEHLLLLEGGRYELSERVTTDFGLFGDLVAGAEETDDVGLATDLLHQALGLVRGEPFDGVGRSYAWAGPHRAMIVAQVLDAAEELAEIHLATGDLRLAEWAARRGLRAFPGDERMYRLLMRTARTAGNIPGVQRVFRELCDVIADSDPNFDPEDALRPETIQLAHELTGTPPANGHHIA
jgi:DNA-binding SARP family transcriptional activator